MTKISTFKFEQDKFDLIKKYHYWQNWPVVYMIENWKEFYIWESINVYNRCKQHYDKEERSKLNNIHIITDDEYNKSAALDIESWLIQYMIADGKYKLQNGNWWLKNHNYYDKEKYKAKFDLIWKELQSMSFAEKDLKQIQNSNIFKYSPYKSLTDEQFLLVEELYTEITSNEKNTYIVNGWAWTWKTILAIYLLKHLLEQEETKNLKVALVIPMTSLRTTLKKVFRSIKWWLKSSMVIWPSDVVKKEYDLLIIDEAHRLKQRKNIPNYKSFDDVNRKLWLDNSWNELDWIMMSSKHQILLYDSIQTIKPTDIDPIKFISLNAKHLHLTNQLRVEAWDDYIEFISDLFSLKNVDHYNFSNYDLKVYSNLSNMVNDIKEKDKEYWLCRVVAGYAWERKTKKDSEAYDIIHNNIKLRWNSTNVDWPNSKNAINEVWCIHTIQWYDLNYVWVIIWPELSYDPINKKLIIRKELYKDFNWYRSISDPKELEIYIINIYKTLLTRWIKGTYIYIFDNNLEKYLLDQIK
jgi:DUF2075 family protein/DNA replication protein DnaC